MSKPIIETCLFHAQQLMKKFKSSLLLVLATTSLAACNINEETNKESTQENEKQKLNYTLPENTILTRDLSYGTDSRHLLDIYAPKNAKNAPIIMMLYGAGFYEGEKENPLIYIHKLKRWGPKGFIIIPISTRSLPKNDAYSQIEDLALAVVSVQNNAKHWGGDPKKLFIMGHSSGGHLVSLLSAKPSLVTDIGGLPWLGSFALDSSSMNVPFTMSLWHPDFFDKAFGKDTSKWADISPIDQLTPASIPLFAACSTQMKYSQCANTSVFAEKANENGVTVEVFPVDLSHGEVNDFLGLESEYTKAAERFMAERDPAIATLLNIK